MLVCWDELWGGYHGAGVVSIGAVEGLDVFKLKHVSLYEGFSDLLVGPRDEELVVMICFLCQPGGEVDGGLQVHPLPVGGEEISEHLAVLF